jgi:hypothetical protein
VICPKCQNTNEENSMYCGDCGNTITRQPSREALPQSAIGDILGQADHITSEIPVPFLSSASQYPRTPGEQYTPDNRAGRYIPVTQAPGPAFRLDLRRLSRVERTAGGATLIVLISLFLPWFGFDELGTNISITGPTAHGYLVVVVVLAVLMAGYLLWRSGWQEFPVRLPVTHQTLLFTATGLQFLLIATAFSEVPVTGLSREAGAYVALAASLIAVGPAAVAAVGSRRAPRTPGS